MGIATSSILRWISAGDSFGSENKQQFRQLVQVKNPESMIFIVKVVLTSLVHHLLNSTAGK